MHGPSGVPSSARVQRRDSLNNPLLGFSSPTRSISNPPPPTSLSAAPLLGFQFPSTHQEERVHVRPLVVCQLPNARRPARPPRCYRSVLPAGPTPPATVSLTGFPNLAATSSSPRRPAIFRRVALVGFTLQGVVPRMKPRRLVATNIPS